MFLSRDLLLLPLLPLLPLPPLLLPLLLLLLLLPLLLPRSKSDCGENGQEVCLDLGFSVVIRSRGRRPARKSARG
jgi:hypothetical protein